MFKFIHAADIHLDSPLRGLERYEGAPVEEIRGATRQALEKLVELAIGQEVDFVLIAGDLYDGDWKDHNTGLYFVKQMVKLRDAKVRVFLISGNHDAANKMTKSLRLPKNHDGTEPMLSHKKAQTVKLEDLGVAIHGRGFASAQVTDNVVLDYPAADPGLFNIGILHTSLDGESEDEHAKYAPCKMADLVSKEHYHYWALGHIHKRDVRHSDPHVVYSGNIQGRHIREAGPKGCYLVSVDDHGRPDLEFQPLDVLRWEQCRIDADGAASGEEVLIRFSQRLIQLMGENDGMPLALRVELTGRCSFHRQLAADPIAWANQIRAEALATAGGSVWIEKVQFHTSAPRQADDSALDDGPVAMLTKLIDEYRNDPELLRQLGEEELADLHRKIPDADTENDPDRLRQSLDQVEQLLLKRLL